MKQACVSIIGMGALGTVIAHQLVRYGVGNLRLIDRDFVEESNLQRQSLYDEEDVAENRPKVIAAEKKLKALSSTVEITPYLVDVNELTIEELVLGSNVLIDATDNWKTRFLLNDVSFKHRIPWIYGAAVRSRGMMMSLVPGQTPCLRCLFDQPVEGHGETCDTVGVLATITHIVGSLQASEAIKLLMNADQHLQRDLLQVDVWNNDIDTLPVSNSINPSCICCQQHVYEFLDQLDNLPLVSQLCGRDSIQITPRTRQKIDLQLWEKRWQDLGQTARNPFLLRLTLESYSLILFTDGRLIVQGTDDMHLAQKLYRTYVGV